MLHPTTILGDDMQYIGYPILRVSSDDNSVILHGAYCVMGAEIVYNQLTFLVGGRSRSWFAIDVKRPLLF